MPKLPKMSDDMAEKFEESGEISDKQLLKYHDNFETWAAVGIKPEQIKDEVSRRKYEAFLAKQ